MLSGNFWNFLIHPTSCWGLKIAFMQHCSPWICKSKVLLTSDLWTRVMCNPIHNSPKLEASSICTDDPLSRKILLVMGFCSGGSLFAGDIMTPKRPLTELAARRWFRDILSASLSWIFTLPWHIICCLACREAWSGKSWAILDLMYYSFAKLCPADRL